MLQVARLAPKLLGDSADLVRAFLARSAERRWRFKDRSGRSDLYYTVFGLEGLLALQAPLPAERVIPYLESFGAGESLDFVHLCCLIRCWAALGPNYVAQRGSVVGGRGGGAIGDVPGEGWRVQRPRWQSFWDGLWRLSRRRGVSGPWPTDARWAASCAEPEVSRNPGWRLGERARIESRRDQLHCGHGDLALRLGMPVAPAVGDWLLRAAHREGGFVATPGAPIPDLLSTATALHALAGLERDFSTIKEPCLDFIDTLWTNEGGFHGHWGDDSLDCEYTYYGLLALGHLSL
jgi:hypothetical protein